MTITTWEINVLQQTFLGVCYLHYIVGLFNMFSNLILAYLAEGLLSVIRLFGVNFFL